MTSGSLPRRLPGIGKPKRLPRALEKKAKVWGVIVVRGVKSLAIGYRLALPTEASLARQDNALPYMWYAAGRLDWRLG